MAIILTETYESLTNSDLIRSAARQLGESENAVSAAISAAGMAILARLSQLSGDASLMGRVASLIDTPTVNDGSEPTPALGGTTAAAKLGRGTALLNIVYGPRLQGLVDALAGYASISPASARAAIGHAAPLVLKALGERLSEHGPQMTGLAPTAAQLADVLVRDRESIALDVPPVLAALDKPAVRARPPVAGAVGTVASAGSPQASYRGATSAQTAAGSRTSAGAATGPSLRTLETSRSEEHTSELQSR